ncbi:Uncharacterized protein APZ42_033431 [Daphnia magna]|uniref:Reverse transcriptase domain-containing protein n=1 Tax=Daphnia magna TaxID=35525 RepID=A0A164L3G1_9CRUS|nr:Uncharacterized protein APZ42_033431 [Daphnia magna]
MEMKIIIESHCKEMEKAGVIEPSNRPWGAVVVLVMAMGLCSVPGTFQRMMDVVLSGLRCTTCLVYLDDIEVYSRSVDEHVQGLRGVLGRLRGANLQVKMEKCTFAQPQLRALGHIVDKNRVSPDPKKIQTVQDFLHPPTMIYKLEVEELSSACLGKWAVSMNNPRSLVMECPQQTDSRDSSRAELPLVGIVEIQHGCSTQTDEWFLQASRRHLLSPTRKGKNFLPRLKGVNWALASLRRIGSSLVSAASSRKTILALEEDDWEREKRASGHHTYPFELWGVGAAFFMVSVSVFSIQCCRGRRGGANIADLREHLWTLKEFVEEEAKKRRAWRWSTMNCLTVIDNRMTAHEQTCLATLRDLELSIKYQARQRRILLSELIRIGHVVLR